jgi:tetratricopeptide (TPR) repeat protein
VLVLEDLHWADPTSLRLTAELAELAADRPLLLIATSRPGRHVLPSAREIRLRPLATDAAEALATSLLGKVGGPQVLAPVLITVLASADGNPLFLEERLAEMLEAGTLVRHQHAWRLREPANPPLPQLLERLVRARVDRLSPPAADAIRAAAVLGAEFSSSMLAHMVGTTPDSLSPLLTELTDSDLVHHQEDSRSRFLFRHALIQEATYLALLRAERRELHARAARAIEVAATGRLAEVAAILGRHYVAAEDNERAVHYLELAGDHATDAFANDEALSSFREALTVIERGGGAARDPSGNLVATAVRLHAKLANVLWRTARWDETRAAFLTAIGLADAGPRPLDPLWDTRRAHLHTRLGRFAMSEGRHEEANAAFDAAEALLGADAGRADVSDDAVLDQWLELMIDGRADLHVRRFQPDLALAVLERARPALEARGAPARKMAFHRFYTTQKLLRNRLRVEDEDIANLRASVEEAEFSGGDRDKDVGYATGFLGWVLWLRGDLCEADEELNRAVILAERVGEALLCNVALSSLTLTALRRHDAQAVRALLPRSVAASKAVRHDFESTRPAEAWLAWQDGRPDEVLRLTAEIEEWDATRLGWGAMHRWVYLFPALAAHQAADATAEAVAAARRIIDPSQQALPDDLTAALATACESWDQGDQERAARHLRKALDLATEHAYF